MKAALEAYNQNTNVSTTRLPLQETDVTNHSSLNQQDQSKVSKPGDYDSIKMKYPLHNLLTRINIFLFQTCNYIFSHLLFHSFPLFFRSRIFLTRANFFLLHLLFLTLFICQTCSSPPLLHATYLFNFNISRFIFYFYTLHSAFRGIINNLIPTFFFVCSDIIYI